MACHVCPLPSKEYSKFHSSVRDDTAEGNLNLTPFSTSTLKVQQPLFLVLLFNQQLSSYVGGGPGHHHHSHMPQQRLHGYLTEGQLPLLLASLAFGAQPIKIFDEGRNILLFSIESSLNPFFSSSFNNNFRTSEEREKPHVILTNANVQQKKKKN